MLLLDSFHVSYFAYGTALINALVIAKVILIGEAVHAGARFEGKALIYSAIWKAFVLGLFVFAFHIIEEMIKHLVHGKDLAGAFQNIHIDDLLARAVIIFCTFIPLFAFGELRRVMGQDKFQERLKVPIFGDYRFYRAYEKLGYWDRKQAILARTALG